MDLEKNLKLTFCQRCNYEVYLRTLGASFFFFDFSVDFFELFYCIGEMPNVQSYHDLPILDLRSPCP